MEAVYGINPIKVLLSRDTTPLKKILIAEGRSGPPLQEILALARQKNIPVEWVPRQRLDGLTGQTGHQGIAGFRDAFAYADLEDVLKNRSPRLFQDLVLILDGILDPQNLGSVIRSAYCLGANGVVIPADRSASVTPAVMKSSAGSAQHLPVARVTNLSRTIDDLKNKGFWIYGADARGGKNIREQSFGVPVALVLGSESRGLRPLIRKKCDFIISIPMAGNFDSLNVAVAAGIIQYEILLQRLVKPAGLRT
ncbi:MAG: 23S rRNA (guanosine(2251)-2'-O)-methyltransferase RlmB [Smithella sp.]|jgi:23S rRNA (guanosine2251-2'-O)-methyltransferase|nr:23S rRNA (guanosine(2251)-2'-O)-methyltransferase RlmB [Smithella sp.]